MQTQIQKPKDNLSWSERLNQFQVYPEAAKPGHIMKMAEILSSIQRPTAKTCWDGREHDLIEITYGQWCTRCGFLYSPSTFNPHIPTMFDELVEEGE